MKEQLTTVNSPDEAFGLYLAENLDRKWKDDFVDEDTGETISIPRTERIADKGEKVDNDLLPKLRFLMQSGDVESILCSNQSRKGNMVLSDSKMVWEITIKDLDGAKKIISYANGISDAIDRANEFVELSLTGVFNLTQLKELGDMYIVPYLGEKPTKGKYYKIEARFTSDDELQLLTFLTFANNADDAMIPIKYFMRESIDGEFDCSIMTAKTVSCNYLLNKD